MQLNQELLWLFSEIVLVLVCASSISALLKWRIAKGQPHAMIDNLTARINAWWGMIILLGIAFSLHKYGVMGLFFFISFAALREFLSITYTRQGDHFMLQACFFIFLPLQYYFIWTNWYGMYSILIPVYAFLFLPMLSLFSGDTTHFLQRTATVQWALMICVLCISYVPALLTLPLVGFEGRNLLLIAFLILVVQSSDVFQYVFGKLAGKHKVAPKLSPSKTVEGLIGGVVSASLLGAAMAWMTPFSVWQAGLIAMVICLMGFLGGLVMSAIKRDRGIKDWGHMIEGHGGMLDRLDSICFAAPIFFHIVRYWWTAPITN